jgi:DNA polymerase III subunit delta'
VPIGPPMGNAAVRARLGELGREGRLHGCLLFEGPKAVGKAMTARWLAQVWNCEVGGVEPCGACWSCRQIAKGSHPDVIAVGIDPDRRNPIISVDQARQVIVELQVKPFHARRRVVILDPADAMNPQAANALLKTFEEPRPDTGFVLVTSAVSKIIPTILSRCQRVRFGPVSADELVPFLRTRGIADPERLAVLAEGCPGKALALAEGGTEAWIEVRDALLQALETGQSARFELVARFKARDDRAGQERLLDVLSTLVRDAIAVRGGGRQTLFHDDRRAVVESWARRLGYAGAARIAVAIDRTREDIEINVSPQMALDGLIATVHAELGA